MDSKKLKKRLSYDGLDHIKGKHSVNVICMCLSFEWHISHSDFCWAIVCVSHLSGTYHTLTSAGLLYVYFIWVAHITFWLLLGFCMCLSFEWHISHSDFCWAIVCVSHLSGTYHILTSAGLLCVSFIWVAHITFWLLLGYSMCLSF